MLLKQIFNLFQKNIFKIKVSCVIMNKQEKSISSLNERIRILRQKLDEKESLLVASYTQIDLLNEQIQSAYKELMTANEELQTMKKKLLKLNSDYRNKSAEATQTANDLNNLLLNSEIGAIYIDNSMCIRKMTAVIENISNLAPNDIGRSIKNINFIDEYPNFVNDVENVFQNNVTIKREINNKHNLSYLLIISPYKSEGIRTGVLVTIFNITIVKQVHNQLLFEKEQAEIIAAMSANALFKYDIKNDVFIMLLNKDIDFPEKNVLNYSKYMYDKDLIHKDDIEVFKEYLETIRNKEGHFIFQFRQKFIDGKFRFVEAETKTVLDNNKKPIYAIGKYTDIDNKRKEEIRLYEESTRDTLTGLFRKNHFNKIVENHLKTASSNSISAFIIMDLDDFKSINDTYGHLFGDTILINISEGLKMISDNNIIAGRFGGDEFMIFIKYIPDKSYLTKTIDSIYDMLSAKYATNEITNKVTFSMGAALAPYDASDFNDLFAKADFALFQSKIEGKNRWMLFEDCKNTFDSLTKKSSKYKMYVEDYENSRLTLNEEIVEYIIEILGGISDFKVALSLICENIGRHLGLMFITMRRINFENNSFPLEFYWEESSGFPEINNTQIENKQAFSEFIKLIENNQELFIFHDWNKDNIPICIRNWIETKNILSSIHCVIKNNNNIYAVLSFGSVDKKRKWPLKEIKMIKMISRVLSLRISSSHNLHVIEEKVKKLTLYDKVTGLHTYPRFIEEANKLLSENRKDKDYKYAIVYSDFTNFKHINDTYGYMVGDKIIKEFAKFAVTDNPMSILGTRQYADNVLCIVKTYSSEGLTDRIINYNKIFSQKQNNKYPGLNLVISTGGYIIDDNEKDIINAIDNANIARKIIKSRQNGGFTFFEPEMLTLINKQVKILSDFPNALKNNEFKMYLQPQINIMTGKIFGAEALVRWIKSDGTIIYPNDFIPELKKNRTIIQLDFYMLEQALKTLNSWTKQNIKIIPISVNFSRLHFYDIDFADNLYKMTVKYDIQPKYIDIEVTEDLFMDDYEKFADNIKKLHKYGFSISIDDFGVGYSSLSILTNLEVQAIKIDKSFLYSAEKSTIQKNIIEYTFALANQLNLGVVCEGVENEEQLEFLKKVGCQIVQGYYYDKPLSLDKFESKWLYM